MENNIEFKGIRAELYEEALIEYPLARMMDIEIMYRNLNPAIGDKILGFGEGNGYFCSSIASSIGVNGKYLITDPSIEQLKNLKKRVNFSQIEIKQISAEEIDVANDSFDKVWSFGAFHHCSNQTEAMKKIYSSLKKGGKAVICDVFQGSPLARHFDSFVARYCISGHEVKFLSEEFARTICLLAGFKENNIKIIDLPIKWYFDSEEAVGDFIYKLHALTFITGSKSQKIKKVYASCFDLLGINKIDNKYELNWPMKVIVAIK